MVPLRILALGEAELIWFQQINSSQKIYRFLRTPFKELEYTLLYSTSESKHWSRKERAALARDHAGSVIRDAPPRQELSCRGGVIDKRMIPREILKTNLKNLNGFIPVYKPAGMCSHRLSEGLRLDLYFVTEHYGLNHGNFTLSHARDLEPFADGLMTFMIGYKTFKKRNFVRGDYIYRADIEFGVKRRFDSIDGEVLDRLPTDHVTASKIMSKLPEYMGHLNQNRCPSYRHDNTRDNKIWASRSQSSKTYIDLYNQMILADKSEKKKPRQKYPYVAPPRTYFVKNIVLDQYTGPIATFTITSQGSLSIRRFASDIAAELGTYANVTKLTRVREGPIHIDDIRVFHTYELNLEYYIERLAGLKELYGEFNDQISPLWCDSD